MSTVSVCVRATDSFWRLCVVAFSRQLARFLVLFALYRYVFKIRDGQDRCIDPSLGYKNGCCCPFLLC